MSDLSDAHLKIVQTILQRHVPECEVRLFGSRSKRTAKPYSDLDLAIVGKEKISRKILHSLKDDFQESDLPFRVDVLDWHAVSREFQAVINEGFDILQSGGVHDA